MTIARVQEAHNTAGGVTNITATLGATPTPGNLLIAFGAKRNGTTVMTVTLDNGTWVQVDRRYTGSTAGEWPIVMWYQFVVGSLGTATKMTWSGAGDNQVFGVMEFSGLGSYDAGSQIGASAFTGAATGTLTPGVSSVEALLVSQALVRTDITPGTIWTAAGSMSKEFENAARPPMTYNYQIVSSTSGGYTTGSTGGAAAVKARIAACFLGGVFDGSAAIGSFFPIIIA